MKKILFMLLIGIVVITSYKTITATTLYIGAISPTQENLKDGQIFKKDDSVRIFFSEATATLNGSRYISGTYIVEPGDYTLILTDTLGSESVYHFTIEGENLWWIWLIGFAILGGSGFLVRKFYMKKV